MRRFLVVAVLILFSGTACAPPASGPAAGGPPTAGVTTPPVPATAASNRPPADPGESFRVTYGWAVPSTEASVANPVSVPLPGAIALPYLVEIRTGDHPTESPAYTRITFTFAGAVPSYRLSYVRQVVSDGSGNPVPLPGNAFLRIVFDPAQAHDAAGRSTVRYAAPTPVGLGNLAGYAPAGDFEGYVTYGLGVRVAPGSDQTPQIRTGQVSRPDPSGGTAYVVAIDVRTG